MFVLYFSSTNFTAAVFQLIVEFGFLAPMNTWFDLCYTIDPGTVLMYPDNNFETNLSRFVELFCFDTK